MKTDVAILHHEYSPKTRDYVAEKLQHLVRFYEGTVSVRAVLERIHDEHRVELIGHVRKGMVLVVEARQDSIHAAVEEAVHRMGRVLRRHKDRLKSHRRARAS